MTLPALSIYPSVHNQLMRTLFEGQAAYYDTYRHILYNLKKSCKGGGGHLHHLHPSCTMHLFYHPMIFKWLTPPPTHSPEIKFLMTLKSVEIIFLPDSVSVRTRQTNLNSELIFKNFINLCF